MINKKILLLLIIILTFASCQEDQKSIIKKLTADELKGQLLILELSDPLNYLSLNSFRHEENMVLVRSGGLFRSAQYSADGWNIFGSIKNSALLASYKDITLSLSFYSQTKTLIEKKDIVVYEFSKPGGFLEFTLKVNPPDGANDVKIEIKSATPFSQKTK